MLTGTLLSVFWLPALLRPQDTLLSRQDQNDTQFYKQK